MKTIPQELCQALQASYPTIPLSLIGCRAAGYAHPVCEYDVLAVTESRTGSLRRLLRGYYIDLHFTTMKNLKNILQSELAITFYHARHLSDPGWLLTSISSRLKSLRLERLKHTFLTRRMRSALVKMGRFYEALSEGNLLDTAYWLHSSSYDYSDCMTVLMGDFPSPSHTITQMQKYSRAEDGDFFRIWCDALGMDLATHAGVIRRLEALLTILKPLGGLKQQLQEPPENWVFGLMTSPHYFPVTEEKARHLVKAHKVLEAYCYLGREVVKAIEELYTLQCTVKGLTPTYSKILTMLSEQKPSILRPDFIRMLAFDSEEHILRNRGQGIRRLIGLLGRKLS